MKTPSLEKVYCVLGGEITIADKAERGEALYANDMKCVLHKSHENPAIVELYDTYLGKPGSEKAHGLLHTSYVMRN